MSKLLINTSSFCLTRSCSLFAPFASNTCITHLPAAKPFPFFPNCPILFSQLGKNIFLTGEVESCNLAILHPSSHAPTRMRTRAYYKV